MLFVCVEYKKFTQRSSSVEFFKKAVALKVSAYQSVHERACVYVCVCVCLLVVA